MWKIKKKSCQVQTLTAKNQFIETFTQSVDNTAFLTLRFLHFFVLMVNFE